MKVFWTRVGDVPERIVVIQVDSRHTDFSQWRSLAPARELLRAERPWEGADIEPAPSAFDWAPDPVNQLRDPFVYEEDGKLYLLYTGAGEAAIGIARLTPTPSS